MRYKRLKVSKMSDIECKGIYPNRYVLLLIEGENRAHPYSTHLEIFPYDGNNAGIPFVAHGDYCQTIEEAEKSLKYRMDKYLISLDTGFIADTEFQGK